MLAGLRLNYLQDLPVQIDEIEESLLHIERAGFDLDLVHDLFRRVHSLKGSGGTYELHAVCDVCQAFEDFMSDSLQKKQFTQFPFIDFALRYIDILRRVCGAYLKQDQPDRDSALLLQQLRLEVSDQPYSVLIVENSDVVVGMLRESLLNYGYRIEVAQDGYSALGRLLTEPFTLVITALETKRLNGIATISALQKNQSRTNKTTSILLTSSEIKPEQHDADFALVKNTQLKHNFLQVLDDIKERLDARENAIAQ